MSLITTLSPHVFSWIVQCALVSSVLLGVAYFVAGACRQPADRLRVLQWMLGITLLSLVVVALPRNWKIAIPVVTHTAADRLPPTADTLSSAPELMDQLAPALEQSRRSVSTSNTSRDSEPISAMQPEAGQSVLLSASSAKRSVTIDWLSLLSSSLAILYLTGVTLCVVRWSVARLRLHRLYQTSSQAPAAVREQFAGLTGNSGEHVRLRLSHRVAAPITWGLWAPVIMLPQSVVTKQEPAAARYSLAHEWAHIRRRDAWTWQLAVCLHVFLYYHPLFWLVRRTLLVSMDRLADAEAAGQGDSPIDYAEFLVHLARDSQRPNPQLALGVSDKHSQLRQRVEYLLSSNRPTNMFCSPARSIGIAFLAVVIGMASSVVRFEARATADDQSKDDQSIAASDQQTSAPDGPGETTTPDELLKQIVDIARPQVAELLKVCSQQHEDGSITYYGFVTDATTGMPITGALVKVYHKLSRDPKTGGWSTIEVTEHKSNAIGLYGFTLPAEQTAQSSLYIEIEAEHPQYACIGRSGYSHGMIRKNLELGELPFYTQIKLWPGQPIEGTIVTPEGKPLADVEVSMYAASDKATGFPAGSFDKTTTDDNGRFRIVPPTPGDGVLWIKPADYSPQAHRIADRRGDWGEIKMEVGATITGRVLDVNGQPVPNVRVEARRQGDGERADEYLQSNAVANQIGRSVATQEDGAFTLASLPEGDYTLEIDFNAKEGEYDPPPLREVFLRQSLKIADKRPQQITIQAVPHVVLQGTYLNSKNEPCSGHEVMLFGRIDDSFYFARSSTPGNDGKFELKIPHGLREAKLDLVTNEHSALKWRMSRDKPLERGRDVTLGTVEDDIYGFEVVRYTAPLLMVKAVDEQGRIVADITPVVTYAREANESENMTVYTTGSHVSFEAQGDGRHRSSQLLPDEPIKVTVKKEGFNTTIQELTLKEGQEQEIQFVLKAVSETKPDTDADKDD